MKSWMLLVDQKTVVRWVLLVDQQTVVRWVLLVDQQTVVRSFPHRLIETNMKRLRDMVRRIYSKNDNVFLGFKSKYLLLMVLSKFV